MNFFVRDVIENLSGGFAVAKIRKQQFVKRVRIWMKWKGCFLYLHLFSKEKDFMKQITKNQNHPMKCKYCNGMLKYCVKFRDDLVCPKCGAWNEDLLKFNVNKAMKSKLEDRS